MRESPAEQLTAMEANANMLGAEFPYRLVVKGNSLRFAVMTTIPVSVRIVGSKCSIQNECLSIYLSLSELLAYLTAVPNPLLIILSTCILMLIMLTVYSVLCRAIQTTSRVRFCRCSWLISWTSMGRGMCHMYFRLFCAVEPGLSPLSKSSNGGPFLSISINSA